MASKAKTTRPLTIKQTKFVKAYVANDGNGRDAAKAVYDVANDNSASQLASENLSKPNVKYAIEKALEKHHITMDAAVKPIADGLQAERVTMTEHGADVSPDHSVRLKASAMALKLMGADKDTEKPNSVVFNFKGGASFNAKDFTK